MRKESTIQWYIRSILNGYSQVFFSDQTTFAIILLVITFVDFYTGLAGLLSVITTTALARWMGYDKFRIHQGYYGFNALLVGLGLGIYFQPGMLLLLMVLLAAVLTLFLSITLEGVIGKYALPHLSLPFVLALWAIMLASRDFQALGLNERGIYTFNDLYVLGGAPLVHLYEWWAAFPFPSSLRAYFLSMGAIFFQINLFTGVLVATGLLVFSRIGFTLSLLGFYTAYLFYLVIGAEFSEVAYSYIGFNYILSAVAIGGYFIIPNRSSFLWVILLIPLVAIMTISLSSIFSIFRLPVYSLPFNIIALLFLYVLKFRQHNRLGLNTLFVQQNSPERNLYAFTNYMKRFGRYSPIPLYLPFFGPWTVTQGHQGDYTHKEAWRHAWDFEMKDETGLTYRNKGDYPEDYYCFGKTIIAPADGQIEMVADDVEDNKVGDRNLERNWGNTIVVRHHDTLFTQLSHLQLGSLRVQEGQKVKKGEPLARCGNSGNSPFPHLHFQIQETPFIGSKTLDYPLSNYLLEAPHRQLKIVDIPCKDETVANIIARPELKKAFRLIPGEVIRWTISGGKEREAQWEVSQDTFGNHYIECTTYHCKAWFCQDDVMLYFTHFEGRRDTLLYYFYLGAFKVCFGFLEQLELTDSYPLNMIFRPRELFFHDFVAPFVQIRATGFRLRYLLLKETIGGMQLLLKTQSWKKSLAGKKTVADTEFLITPNGLEQFNIITPHHKIQATCTKGLS